MQERSIDDSTKQIIEVTNSATTEMLQKVTQNDIDAFQAYTIRNLDNKLSIGSDIEQYKLMSITEDPLVPNRMTRMLPGGLRDASYTLQRTALTHAEIPLNMWTYRGIPTTTGQCVIPVYQRQS